MIFILVREISLIYWFEHVQKLNLCSISSHIKSMVHSSRFLMFESLRGWEKLIVYFWKNNILLLCSLLFHQLYYFLFYFKFMSFFYLHNFMSFLTLNCYNNVDFFSPKFAWSWPPKTINEICRLLIYNPNTCNTRKIFKCVVG